MSVSGRTTPNDGGFVFWMLMVLGFSVFTPCVLWPEWRDVQTLQAAQLQARQHLESLRRVVDQEKRLLVAMQTDPGVISRIARRDLQFTRAGELAIPVDVSPVMPEHADHGNAVTEGQGADRSAKFIPRLLLRLADILPDWDYQQVFGSEQTRTILIVMSIALIALSFVLFGGCTTSSE